MSCFNVLLLNSAFPLRLHSVSFFNFFPTKLYAFITITKRARCPNQSQNLKKLLHFNRAKFAVKGHDSIDDGGLLLCRWPRPFHGSVGFGQHTETKSDVNTSGGQSDALQIAQGRRTSGGEPAQMFRPVTQQLAMDGSVQPST